MFQDHFRLTVAENKGTTAISLFVILIYCHYWNAAPLTERATLNDTRLLAQIKTYHNTVIRDVAAKAIPRHLWYFSEHLVGLSLFDFHCSRDRCQAGDGKETELLTNAR